MEQGNMLTFKHIKIFLYIVFFSLNALAHEFTAEQNEAINNFNKGIDLANQKKTKKVLLILIKL